MRYLNGSSDYYIFLPLTEATTGVDSASRERFWAVLEHLKGMGHTIIFTSFHTEECVNLATKIAVISEGHVQCLGAPDSVQKRYAKGYTLTFRLRHEMLTRVDIASATVGKISEFKKTLVGAFL